MPLRRPGHPAAASLHLLNRRLGPDRSDVISQHAVDLVESRRSFRRLREATPVVEVLEQCGAEVTLTRDLVDRGTDPGRDLRQRLAVEVEEADGVLTEDHAHVLFGNAREEAI